VLHYVMGGIHTDINTATSMPGLYAVGECACVNINGANRLGSNSLTELLVFGARAGQAAVDFAAGQSMPPSGLLEAQVSDEQERIARQFIRKTDGTERLATLRLEMNEAMESGVGIYRDAAGTQATCDKLAELQDRFNHVSLDDHSLSFNTELTAALELENMLDIARAAALAAHLREESRGAHQRTDFPPPRDDENWLKHSLAFRTDDGPRIEYLDVTITRWPPAKRTYGS
jgi:fumarate reductase flavoprotein subunit